MSDMSDLFFEIKDANGEPHQYVCTPHIATDGFQVIDAMLAIGLGPVAEALFSAARAAETERQVTQSQEGLSLATIIDHMNLDHAITSLQAGMKSVGGLQKLAPLVFAHTTRDGNALVDPRNKNTAHMDLAYTRNYKEMLYAFQRVMQINGFFDVLAGFFTDED